MISAKQPLDCRVWTLGLGLLAPGSTCWQHEPKALGKTSWSAPLGSELMLGGREVSNLALEHSGAFICLYDILVLDHVWPEAFLEWQDHRVKQLTRPVTLQTLRIVFCSSCWCQLFALFLEQCLVRERRTLVGLCMYKTSCSCHLWFPLHVNRVGFDLPKDRPFGIVHKIAQAYILLNTFVWWTSVMQVPFILLPMLYACN